MTASTASTKAKAKAKSARDYTKESLEFLDGLLGKGHRTFAHLLESFRLCEGWSQAELARRMKCSRAYINAVEKGHTTVSLAQAEKFARLFGVVEERWVAQVLEDTARNAGYELQIEFTQIKKARGAKR